MEFEQVKLILILSYVYIFVKIIKKIEHILCKLTSFPNNLFALLVNECFQGAEIDDIAKLINKILQIGDTERVQYLILYHTFQKSGHNMSYPNIHFRSFFGFIFNQFIHVMRTKYLHVQLGDSNLFNYSSSRIY